MIVKVIKRDKATSDFGKLGNYILEGQNDESEILWTRTADYIMDVKGDGEKLAWFAISNCQSETPAEAISEILLTQSENVRSKNDKTYHLVISFREGEQVTREQMKSIEESICNGLGFEGHQRLSACHINTENTHLHIAVNKVHPETHRCVEPYYPYLKLNDLCRELEMVHGLEKDNRIVEGNSRENVSQMETHSGEQSLLGWIKETIDPVLKDCKNWEEMHSTLANFGLVIKPRGAGLVIATQDGQMAVKASSVNRSLSLKVLTSKLGEFQASNTLSSQYKALYERKPGQTFHNSSALYADYKRQQDSVWMVRKKLKSFQANERKQFMDDLKQWHITSRNAIKRSKESPAVKQAAYQQIALERNEKLKQNRAAQKEHREATYKAYPIQTWQSFLMKSAEEGNTQALEVLRYRKRRQEHISKAIFTAQDIDAAKHIVLKEYKPYVRKNGDLVYRVSDGGVVTDEMHHVRVDENTTGAAFLALNIAAERFKDQPLEVKGEEAFKQEVVQLAVHYDYVITFSDSAMELERQRQRSLKQPQEPSIRQAKEIGQER